MSSAIACWGGAGRGDIGDRQAFRREFRNYLIQNFAMKVTGLDDGRMAVTNVLQNEDTVVVLTEIGTQKASRDSYAWRVVLTA